MLPDLLTSIPGPESQRLAKELREHECQNTTYVDERWPIFWEKAKGSNIWDSDGNRFLDMSSAFGVTGLGHGRPEILEAMQNQANQLLHGMGDVHPTPAKGKLCRELSRITFERWTGEKGKVMLANAGFEAVECALKSAVMQTGKSGVLSFDRAYHGLGYGALLGIGLSGFSESFADQLASVSQRCSYPTTEEEFAVFKDELAHIDPATIGAVLVEPIQGRGGKRIAAPGFLQALRDWCDAHGVALIFDEIFTGFYRTGVFFACEHDQVVPDYICLGKALSSGFPISACVGKAELMDSWPESSGEAIHTSTYLGHPVGCAMALRAIELFHEPETLGEIAQISKDLEEALRPLENHPKVREVRGRGVMWGVQLHQCAEPAMHYLLQSGVIILPEGENGSVLSFVPPFGTPRAEIDFVVATLLDFFERAEG